MNISHAPARLKSSICNILLFLVDLFFFVSCVRCPLCFSRVMTKIFIRPELETPLNRLILSAVPSTCITYVQNDPFVVSRVVVAPWLWFNPTAVQCCHISLSRLIFMLVIFAIIAKIIITYIIVVAVAVAVLDPTATATRTFTRPPPIYDGGHGFDNFLACFVL